MNRLKLFFTILTYLGIAIIVIGIVIAFQYTIDIIEGSAEFDDYFRDYFQGYYYDWPMVLAFLGCGTLFTLIGGLMARLSFLWIPLIVIGIICELSLSGIYLSSFYGYCLYYIVEYRIPYNYIILDIVYILPGLSLIIEGIVLRKIRTKSE